MVGAIEGLFKINKGSLVELSKQQVVDCSPRGFNFPSKGLGLGSAERLCHLMAEYPYTGVMGFYSYIKEDIFSLKNLKF